jgi:hypothetical protein
VSPGAIRARGEREALVYSTATQIRELLDRARETYGAEAWDADDLEATVLDLVTAEDES